MPSGRAWIQPLDENLEPISDLDNAVAYLVYNGYGDLEGYVGTRIVAYMTSKSYRKIGLNIYGQFVNGDSGYLVADEAICADITSISFDYPMHKVR